MNMVAEDSNKEAAKHDIVTIADFTEGETSTKGKKAKRRKRSPINLLSGRIGRKHMSVMKTTTGPNAWWGDMRGKNPHHTASYIDKKNHEVNPVSSRPNESMSTNLTIECDSVQRDQDPSANQSL
jgi:hypothetical protein